MPALPLTTSYWPADTSSPVLETTIGGVLRAAAERAPGQPALISGDPDPARRRQWRYGELLAEAERGAHALTARFRPGDRVAVWAGNCPEWVLLEFAAGLAGVTLVTVNPAYQADELAHVLGHSGARGIFLAAEHRGSSLPAILATVREPPAGAARGDPARRMGRLLRIGRRWPPAGGRPRQPGTDPVHLGHHRPSRRRRCSPTAA